MLKLRAVFAAGRRPASCAFICYSLRGCWEERLLKGLGSRYPAELNCNQLGWREFSGMMRKTGGGSFQTK